MLPRRSGARFALEALFLALLALGAGLADLRPLVIVIVMAGAWVLVALAELSAARVDRSPLSYLQPLPTEDEEEPQEVFGPRPEERTVVAPPEPPAQPEEEQQPAAVEESSPEAPVAEPDLKQEPLVAEPEAEPEPEPEAVLPVSEGAGWGEPTPEPPFVATDQEPPEPSRPRRLRGLLRRRQPDVEPELAPPPRHVKLLPRKQADEPSGASREVAELFGAGHEDEEPATSEETRR